MGNNNKGQLAMGHTNPVSRRQLNEAVGNIDNNDNMYFTLGNAHGFIMWRNGSISSWGDNSWGQAAPRPHHDNSVWARVGYHLR
ncbi:hypothetical protein P9112_004531 [Eukaryota sp. TZLM1-RC]